jgi:hypothetical protein
LAGLDPAPHRPTAPAARPPAGDRQRTAPPATPEAVGEDTPEAIGEDTPAGSVRRHRPWFEWRGWDSVVTYVVLAVMLAGVITGLHRLLAAGALVIGGSALAWAVTHRPGHGRSTSGYGALLDWLMGAVPRPVYLVVCVTVIVLSLVGLIAG